MELLEQWAAITTKQPDALILLRCGDFYETFGKHAEICSSVLGIALGKRVIGEGGKTLSVAGFPCHALDACLQRLVAAGYGIYLQESGQLIGTPDEKLYQMPELTRRQYELLRNCIIHRIAGNSNERAAALREHLSVEAYDRTYDMLNDLLRLIQINH